MKDLEIQSLLEKYTLVNIVNEILILNFVGKLPRVDIRCIRFLDVFYLNLVVSVEVHYISHVIKFSSMLLKKVKLNLNFASKKSEREIKFNIFSIYCSLRLRNPYGDPD